MKFARMDNNGIYLGMADAIEATHPDVGFYAPKGINVSALGEPPADEPGMWRDNGMEWVEVTDTYRAGLRLAAIDARLAGIDAASTRPLRALLDGSGTVEDRERLEALEREAEALRFERARLAE